MSKIVMTNCTSLNNGGDGVRIEGNVDIEIDGLHTAGNDGHGLNIIETRSILQSIGLPEDTDPRLVFEVLSMLVASQPEQNNEIVTRSRLGQQLRKLGLDLTTITANLVTIASSPTAQRVIQSLS